MDDLIYDYVFYFQHMAILTHGYKFSVLTLWCLLRSWMSFTTLSIVSIDNSFVEAMFSFHFAITKSFQNFS